MHWHQKQLSLSERMAAYCVKTIRHASCSAYRFSKNMDAPHIPFSAITEEIQTLTYRPDENVPTYFEVAKSLVASRDDDLSDILRALPDVKREIILRIYYLEQTEAEVAHDLGMTRNNVHYHKTMALRLLKAMLENRYE